MHDASTTSCEDINFRQLSNYFENDKIPIIKKYQKGKLTDRPQDFSLTSNRSRSLSIFFLAHKNDSKIHIMSKKTCTKVNAWRGKNCQIKIYTKFRQHAQWQIMKYLHQKREMPTNCSVEAANVPDKFSSWQTKSESTDYLDAFVTSVCTTR